VRFDGPGAVRGTVTLRGPSVELRSVQIRSVYCANGTDYAPSYPITQAWITGVATVNGSARHRFVLILSDYLGPLGAFTERQSFDLFVDTGATASVPLSHGNLKIRF
jgi:hypothetical protein